MNDLENQREDSRTGMNKLGKAEGRSRVNSSNRNMVGIYFLKKIPFDLSSRLNIFAVCYAFYRALPRNIFAECSRAFPVHLPGFSGISADIFRFIVLYVVVNFLKCTNVSNRNFYVDWLKFSAFTTSSSLPVIPAIF